MKNVSLMPIVLALTMGLVGSNLYAGEAKPKADTGLTEKVLSSGTGLLKDLGGTAIKTGASAAAGSVLPPLNLNLNLDINQETTNCLTGDTVNNVTGDGNTIQNVLTANCNRVGGATGDVQKFTLSNNKAVTINKIVDMPLLANTSYNFTFAKGSASFAALLNPSVGGLTVTTYTTRLKTRDRWAEHFTFGVEGNAYTAEGLAPMRVYPDGKVEIFFPNPLDPENAIRFDINVLNPRTPV